MKQGEGGKQQEVMGNSERCATVGLNKITALRDEFVIICEG